MVGGGVVGAAVVGAAVVAGSVDVVAPAVVAPDVAAAVVAVVAAAVVAVAPAVVGARAAPPATDVVGEPSVEGVAGAVGSDDESLEHPATTSANAATAPTNHGTRYLAPATELSFNRAPLAGTSLPTAQARDKSSARGVPGAPRSTTARYRDPVPLQLSFVTSAKRSDDLPATPREVAFVGRSNVGKSSLLNALANRRQLAKVSNTPGRTQLINLFTLPSGAGVVDLPGYGYAAVPKREQAGWQAMIEGYLLERPSLELVFVLVDAEIGPTKLDVQMLDWLRHEGVAHTVVATKIDKVRPSKRSGRRQQLAAACGLETGDVVWVSSTKGTGIDQLLGHVNALLAD